MNTTIDKTVASHMMAPLVQKYLQRLQERDLEIRAVLEHADKGDCSPAAREQLRHYAHNLAGSGATYGYPNISNAGRTLEDAINNGAGTEAFLPLAHALLEEVRVAMIAGEATRASEGQGLAAPAVTEPLVKAAENTSKRKKLLVIDDDIGNGRLISEIFSSNVDVLTATSSEAGIEITREHKPDLVLLDVDMPGMSGNAVLRKLQQDPILQATPVVMLTAYHRGTDVVQAMMGGAIGYVVKPFQIDALTAKINDLFAHLDTTVLVADDDESIRDLLYHKFRRTGVNVLVALDGEEALSVVADKRPQLAVVDWMMPGLDGLALLKKLKRSQSTMKTKVVMLTVKRQEQDILDSFKLGVSDYIVKPFIAEEVVVRCLRLLGLSQLQEA